jgi:hypothetical protein
VCHRRPLRGNRCLDTASGCHSASLQLMIFYIIVAPHGSPASSTSPHYAPFQKVYKPSSCSPLLPTFLCTHPHRIRQPDILSYEVFVATMSDTESDGPLARRDTRMKISSLGGTIPEQFFPDLGPSRIPTTPLRSTTRESSKSCYNSSPEGRGSRMRGLRRLATSFSEWWTNTKNAIACF